MFEFSFLDISGSFGLVAYGALTLNFVIGMFMSTGFKKTSYWKKLPPIVNKYPLLTIHNFTAYTALSAVMLHVIFLLLDQNAGFKFSHVLDPLSFTHQPIIVLLGCIGSIGFFFILLTSQKFIKNNVQFRIWKNIHLLAYIFAIAFLIHGLLMDPLLKDRPTDWLDPEKFFAEFCVLLMVVATILRVRFHFKR
jgi:methionine sulfoxide reductase heme-binding subunit